MKAAQIKSLPEVDQTLERRQRDRLPVDVILLACLLSLITIGLVMMTSASISFAETDFGDAFYFAERQLIYIISGLFVAYGVWKTPLSVWFSMRVILLIFGIILLAAVLIPHVGYTVNGSARWMRLGGVNIQISEIVKSFFIIFLAGYLAKHQARLGDSLKPVIVPVTLLLVVAGLLMLEPDYGATVVVFATVFSMMFLAGIRLRFFLVFGGFALLAFAALAYTSSYRMARLSAFLDPWADPFDKGFQLSQSLIAFGRGEWLGVGLGESVQKLLYLPEAHTDFVFAVVAEELGVVGALLVIALYACIAWRAFSIGRACYQAAQHFAAYLSFGVGSWLIFQAYVNVGVNMGVLPTKGLTLPFMSYGGSSMVMSCFSLAMLLRADYELRFQYREKDKERRATS
ncbi:MAG TPA: putative lipid II flippase FtsW [Gammaproteobacteria bacterium]|nr:putative lipid II flippase FtsW [Gammaproteobacteria bacterium]